MNVLGLNSSLYCEPVVPSNFSPLFNATLDNIRSASSSPNFTTTFTVLYGLAISLVLAVGVVANLAVVFVISKTTALHTTTNIHLIGLCITDCVHLASAPILLSVLILHDFVFNDFVCKSYMLAQGVNWFAGTFLLNSMSVHRYLSVRKPRAQRILHRKRCAVLTVILLWVLAFTLLSPLAIFSTKIERRRVDSQTGETVIRGSCVINWRPDWLPTGPSEANMTAAGTGSSGGVSRAAQLSRIFSAYTFLFGFLLPVVINIVVYSLLVNHVRLNRQRLLRRQGRYPLAVRTAFSQAVTASKKATQLSTAAADESSVVFDQLSSSKLSSKAETAPATPIGVGKFVSRSERKRRKLPWKVASLVLIYVTFWAPYWIQQIFLMFMRHLRFFASPRLALITQLLGYCNSAVNPILYACLSTPFRRSLAKVLRCKCGWRSNLTYTDDKRRIGDKNGVQNEHECAFLCCPYVCRCFCDY